MGNEICPFCTHAAEVLDMPGSHSVKRYRCEVCGEFAADRRELAAMATVDKYDGYRVSAIIREAHIHGRPILITNEPNAPTIAGFAASTINRAIRRFPTDVSDRLDRALLNIVESTRYLGDEVRIDVYPFGPMLFSISETESEYIFNALSQRGYVKEKDREQIRVTAIVTPVGWNRVTEIRTKHAPSVQGFIAMWFGKPGIEYAGHSSTEFCNNACKHGFEVGIERAGYKPHRVDFEEYTGDIVNRIISQIRRSKFVVADLTGHRPGVYYEAGFARGLGIDVLYTCHTDDLENAHFDLRNESTLEWDSPDDLAEKLQNKIEAVLRHGPLTDET